MFKNRHVYAVIPARAGSKGLPGKNLMQIAGKSLLQRAIDSATGCLYVDAVIVSTDSEAMLDIANEQQLVGIKREAAAASDTATAADVIRDILNNPEVEIDPNNDAYIVYLQPTSPARTSEHVEQAFDLLASDRVVDGVMSVVEPDKTPYLSLVIGDDGLLSPLFPDALGKNRQELTPTYLPNGAIYIFKLSTFLRLGRFPFEHLVPYAMSAADSIDIDTQADFDRAKAQLEGNR